MILDYSKIDEDSIADNQTVEEVSARILKKHLKAFEELAK